MEPTKRDAEAMLKGASEVGSAVRARAPREYPLYVAMGVFFIGAGLLFDLGDHNSAGAAVAVAVVAVVLVAVMAGTHLPYLQRYQKVRQRSTPMWLEWAERLRRTA